MKKNRKKRLRMYIPDFTFLFLCMFFFLCIYVLLYIRLIRLGYLLEEKRKKFEEMEFINKSYKSQILELTSLENLKVYAEKFNINLKPPDKWCYVYIEKIDPEKVEISDEVCAETKE